MSAPSGCRAKVLRFRTAESIARQVAEARLCQLIAEANEIDLWIREAETKGSHALRHAPEPFAVVKQKL